MGTKLSGEASKVVAGLVAVARRDAAYVDGGVLVVVIGGRVGGRLGSDVSMAARVADVVGVAMVFVVARVVNAAVTVVIILFN